MKKYSLLIIVLIILVGLVSCNSDPEIGIYRSISNSSEIISTRVTQALGFVGNKAYFLSDDGIYSKSEGSESVKIVSKTPSILSASFYNTNLDILFLTNTSLDSTEVYTYNLEDKTTLELTDPDPDNVTAFDNTKLICNNSFFITQDGDNAIFVNYIKDTTTTTIKNSFSTITTLTKVLTSENSILVLGKNASDAYIAELYEYSASTITPSIITYKNYIGFEYYDTDKYLLIDEDNEVYNYGGTTLTDTTHSIDATVSDLYSSQLASFSVVDYVYFKGENYFHRVKSSDGTNKSFILGFAKKLQYDIIDILLPEETPGTFIVFTLQSGIFKLSQVDSLDSSGTVTEF